MVNDLLGARKDSEVLLEVYQNSSLFGPLILDTFPTHLKLSSSTVEVECITNGNPHPILKWVLSKRHSNGDIERTIVTSDEKIFLNNRNFSGNYTCLSTNGLGNNEVTKTIYAYKDLFLDLAPVQIYPAAKTVRFECKSSVATIWYKDGKQVISKGRIKIKGSELVITNSILSDSGFYQCESEDYIGEFIFTYSI